MPVAAVHLDAVKLSVRLRNRVNIGARHTTSFTAYTETKPSVDTDVVIEPQILAKVDTSRDDRPESFERIPIVARTESTRRASDRSVDVKSSELVIRRHRFVWMGWILAILQLFQLYPLNNYMFMRLLLIRKLRMKLQLPVKRSKNRCLKGFWFHVLIGTIRTDY